MARTAGQVITSARLTLTDVDGDRYEDPELLGFITDALNVLKSVRPDLFIGQLSTPIAIADENSAIPVDDQFFRSIVDYVIARCETKDDEAVVSQRAELMFRMSAGALLT